MKLRRPPQGALRTDQRNLKWHGNVLGGHPVELLSHKQHAAWSPIPQAHANPFPKPHHYHYCYEHTTG